MNETTDTETTEPPVTIRRRGTCEDCRHFARLETQCRKNPPTVIVGQGPGGMQLSQVWPPVRSGDWCGEFRSANES